MAHVSGLYEIERAMDRLTKAAGRGVLRRSGIKALGPMAEAARSRAPDDPATGGYDLKKSITVGTKLSRSQKRAARKERRMTGDRTAVEVYMGPGPLPQAIYTEFGTEPHTNAGLFAGTEHPGTSPQPYMRPAWDGGKDQLLADLKKLLWEEIDKAAARAARKAARG